MPMHQGGMGTCVGHAFATVVCEVLLNKYRVAVSRDDLLAKVKTLCPCWEGHNLKAMVDAWNSSSHMPGARIEEDVRRCRLYAFEVEVVRDLPGFEDALSELRQMQSNMFIMASIRMSTAGHGHACVLKQFDPAGRPRMQALNSWGPTEPLLEVTPEKFTGAIHVTVKITGCWAPDSTGSLTLRQQSVPAVNSLYADLFSRPANGASGRIDVSRTFKIRGAGPGLSKGKFFGLDSRGYFLPIDGQPPQEFRYINHDGTYVKIVGGKWNDYRLGASAGDGFVMAYSEHSYTSMGEGLSGEPFEMVLSNCKVREYTDGYWYASDRYPEKGTDLKWFQFVQ